MRSSLLNYYDIYAAWAGRSLSLWEKQGRDAHNGWYEQLGHDGRADTEAIRRHRVQARQVFSYANGQKMGWFNGQDTAEKTFEFMCLQGWQGTHFIHRLNADYTVSDERCDLYDHAFYLLSVASLYELTGQDHYKAWINTIITATDRLRHDHGGWSEDNIDTLPRRQNPHMHLFETHLYLYGITGDARFIERANESLALFKAHFYDAENIGIIEFFNPDWTRSETSSHHGFEPGHAAEWVWLLGWYDRLSGQDHSQIRLDIFDHLSRHATPYLMDKTDITGRPPRNATRRLWVQAEWIKAHLALIEDGYTPAREMLPDLLGHFMADYLTEDGLWCDQFNAQGESIAAAIPTSSLYHIISMIMDLKRVSGG